MKSDYHNFQLIFQAQNHDKNRINTCRVSQDNIWFLLHTIRILINC
jgi:hypothetical protein